MDVSHVRSFYSARGFTAHLRIQFELQQPCGEKTKKTTRKDGIFAKDQRPLILQETVKLTAKKLIYDLHGHTRLAIHCNYIVN